MGDAAESASPSTKPAPSGGRRLPGRTPSGLLGKPGTLQLNSSNTPQAHALPVKRRGSFQQLKKAGTHRDAASSHLDSDSSPSIFAVVKKSTHWEKYGTVLVLLVADELSSDKEAILQMLSAEGYDDHTTDSPAEALKLFAEKEVFPDIVVIDSDAELVDTRQLILQLQSLNPTVAVLVLGSPGGPLGAVGALQAGAADFMAKPLAPDELVARVERHVQRQHVIKLEMEKALEDAKAMMAQLAPASLLGDVMLRKEASGGGGGSGKAGLNSVAETDFEEQMSELSEENHRLGQKVLEMERKLELKDKENRALEAKLNAIDARVAELAAASAAAAAAGPAAPGGGAAAATAGAGRAGASGGGGYLGLGLSAGEGGLLRCQLDSVARANLDLRHKVDELERLMLLQQAQQAQQQQQQQQGAGGQAGGQHGQGGGGAGAAEPAAAAVAAAREAAAPDPGQAGPGAPGEVLVEAAAAEPGSQAAEGQGGACAASAAADGGQGDGADADADSKGSGGGGEGESPAQG